MNDIYLHYLLTFPLITAMAYSPNQNVKNIHNLPHLDTDLTPVDSEFQTGDSEYSRSLVVFPVLLGVIGFIVVVLFTLWMVYRCCRYGGPLQVNSSNVKDAMWEERRLSLLFFLFVAVILALIFAMVGANATVTKGVKKGLDSIDSVDDVVDALVYDSEVMFREAKNIEDDIDEAINSGCVLAADLKFYLDEYVEKAEEFVEYFAEMPSKIETVRDNMREYGVEKKNTVVWIFFCILLFLLAFYLLGYASKTKPAIGCSIFSSVFVMFGLLVICILLLVFLMGIADFCMSPDENVIEIARKNYENSTLQTIEFYLDCEGVNPLNVSLNEAKNATLVLDDEIEDLSGSGGVCEDNPHLLDARASIQVILTAINDALAQIECKPLNRYYRGLMHDGVCDDSYTGFHDMWAYLYFMWTFLLFLSIVATILFHFIEIDGSSQSAKGYDDRRSNGVQMTPNDNSANI